jgi:F-type H+-transporting ATPase subunit b
MKCINNIVLISLVAIVSVMVTGGDLIAAEEAGRWRETYDMILRWVNFLILAFLIIKFARIPLKDFLTGKKEKFKAEIGNKEKLKEKAAAEVNDILTILNESETRFADLKDRILEQGKKRKEQIIEDAKTQSQQLLEETRKRVTHQIDQAKMQLKAEMVDAAIELAMDTLNREVNAEDNEKFVDQFLKAVQRGS